MTLTAADIMVTDFLFVESDATVAEAEELFETSSITALPVLNPDRSVFGLLTPQNLARFHGRPSNNPHAFHAWEICDARPPVTDPFTAVDTIVDVLRESPSTHVLVVNEDRQLTGIINADVLLDRDFFSPVTKAGLPRESRVGTPRH